LPQQQQQQKRCTSSPSNGIQFLDAVKAKLSGRCSSKAAPAVPEGFQQPSADMPAAAARSVHAPADCGSAGASLEGPSQPLVLLMGSDTYGPTERASNSAQLPGPQQPNLP
jgi:hypothetical protein